MLKLLKRFIREEDGQDFAEYALILGAVGVVAMLSSLVIGMNYRLPLKRVFRHYARHEAGKCD